MLRPIKITTLAKESSKLRDAIYEGETRRLHSYTVVRWQSAIRFLNNFIYYREKLNTFFVNNAKLELIITEDELDLLKQLLLILVPTYNEILYLSKQGISLIVPSFNRLINTITTQELTNFNFLEESNIETVTEEQEDELIDVEEESSFILNLYCI